jgi:MFS family permease
MYASDETTFYLLRFLLGIAEAGFFPGVILYLTYWFPTPSRAKAMGLFYFGAPLAFIFGSPLSGLLLELNGVANLKGWQWMFLVEGVLASIVGVWAFFYLDNRPKNASWLSREEQDQIETIIKAENAIKESHGPHSFIASLTNTKVLYLALIYFIIQCSVYGLVFYLPTQVASLLGKNVGFEVGLVTAIPWVIALVAAYLIPLYSDRTGERRLVAAATMSMAGIGMAISVSVSSPLVALIGLCFAAAGFIAVQPIFWTFPTAYLSGAAAAGGIALVNALGALGGFFAPNVKNWAEVFFNSKAAGLYLLTGTTFIGVLLILMISALGLRGQVEQS